MTSAEYFTNIEPIPRGYDSYTGLLIPETKLSDHELTSQELFQRFHALGIGIGIRNLAYWFYDAHALYEPMGGIHVKAVICDPSITYNDVIKRNGVTVYARFLPAYDIDRARDYCDKYELTYNDGPYIVYSERHPDEIVKPLLTISLRGLKNAQYISLINVLEQSLRTDREGVGQLKAMALRARWQNALAASRDAAFKVIQVVQGFF